MQLSEAIAVVTADQRESYPLMNAANAIRHVVETIHVAQLDDDGVTYAAYLAVLTAEAGDLALALAQLAARECETTPLDENDVFVTPGGEALIEGYPALEWLEMIYGEDFSADSSTVVVDNRGRAR